VIKYDGSVGLMLMSWQLLPHFWPTCKYFCNRAYSFDATLLFRRDSASSSSSPLQFSAIRIKIICRCMGRY